MASTFVATFAKAATTAVCLGQTTAGAASLKLNGTQISYPAPGPSNPQVIFANVERTVSLTVAVTDLSGVNVTIAGYDLKGAAVTETRAGPNNNTVETTAVYHIVTSVSVDAAVGTAMSVGSGTTGHTCWFQVDRWQTPTNVGMYAAITATLSFTGKYTYDDVQTVSSPTTITIPSMSATTSSAEATINNAVSAIRGEINSSSGNGAVTLTIIQGSGAVA